jgi:hypothetical protein
MIIGDLAARGSDLSPSESLLQAAEGDPASLT